LSKLLFINKNPKEGKMDRNEFKDNRHVSGDHQRGIERVLQRGKDSADKEGHSGKMKWTSKGNWSHKMNKPQGDY